MQQISQNILRLKDVITKTGLSRSLIYKLIQEGRFPKSIQLTDRVVGWLEHDIDSWINSKIVQ